MGALTNALQIKARDLIERKRADTGHAFADAAKSAIEFWDHASHYMWKRDYDHKPIHPPIEEREAVLYAAIPKSYKKKVAPGHFEELVKRAVVVLVLGVGFVARSEVPVTIFPHVAEFIVCLSDKQSGETDCWRAADFYADAPTAALGYCTDARCEPPKALDQCTDSYSIPVAPT